MRQNELNVVRPFSGGNGRRSDFSEPGPVSPSSDVRPLTWAAEELGIGLSTAYRLAAAGQLPGAFKVGNQWRVSVPRFEEIVHGQRTQDEGVKDPSHQGFARKSTDK